MYAVSKATQTTQRAVCMLMSVAIVTLSLTFGAFGVESMEHVGYSVTVTQGAVVIGALTSALKVSTPRHVRFNSGSRGASRNNVCMIRLLSPESRPLAGSGRCSNLATAAPAPISKLLRVVRSCRASQTLAVTCHKRRFSRIISRRRR